MAWALLPGYNIKMQLWHYIKPDKSEEKKQTIGSYFKRNFVRMTLLSHSENE